MAMTVLPVEYFYTTVDDKPCRAFELLARLAAEDINLLAFSAIPFGQDHVELTIFPARGTNLQAFITRQGLTATGPQHALLVQGDDHLGALAKIHKSLCDAGVQVYASSGVTDGRGHYGYVIYVKEADHVAAMGALSNLGG